jgi:hypothetical protein
LIREKSSHLPPMADSATLSLSPRPVAEAEPAEAAEAAAPEQVAATVVVDTAAAREPPSTPTPEERPAGASPRFSFANNHSSGKAHLRASAVSREELLAKALAGEIWGDTMVRTDAQAGDDRSGEWRRFSDLLRDAAALQHAMGMSLGQLCAAGYGSSAGGSSQSPRRPRATTTSPESGGLGQPAAMRRRAMTNIASSLTRQLFAKNFARSDLMGSPSSGNSCRAAEPLAPATPVAPASGSSATTATLATHTPSVQAMFLSESNVPDDSTAPTKRLPVVGGARIEAFREMSGNFGGRKLGVIASAVSSQLVAVGSAASSAAAAAVPTAANAPPAGKTSAAAAARAALIGSSTGLDHWSPTARCDNSGTGSLPTPAASSPTAAATVQAADAATASGLTQLGRPDAAVASAVEAGGF